MLLHALAIERGRSSEDLLMYPLGLLCFLVDMLDAGTSIDSAICEVQNCHAPQSSIDIITRDQNLINYLRKHHELITAPADATRLLAASLFGSITQCDQIAAAL